MLPLVLLTATLGAGPAPDEPITRKNWSTHPRIVEVRALVQKNEEAIKGGKYKHQDGLNCPEGPFHESASIDRDPAGVIRKYVHDAGTEDASYRVEEHYDERGRLRFAFARRSAANDSSGEFRIYFSEDGKKLWTDVREKGPGYTWDKDFPERWLEPDAEAAWKKPICVE